MCTECDSEGENAPSGSRIIRYPGDVRESDFQSPTRAKQAFDITYQKLVETRTQKERLHQENQRYLAKISALQTQLQMAMEQLSVSKTNSNAEVLFRCK